MLRSLITAMAIAACSAGFTYAQDPKPGPTPKADEVLEKAQSQIYSPKKAGLKDIKFAVSSPMLDPMLGTAKMNFYWKAAPDAPEDKSTIKLEGAGGAAPDNPMLEGMVKNLSKGFAVFFSGQPVRGSKQYDLFMKHTTRTMIEKDGHYVLTINRKPDAPSDLAGVKDSVMTITKDTFRMVRLKTKAQGQDMNMGLTYREIDVDGKKQLLLSGQKMPMAQMGGDVEVTIKWVKKDNIFIPTQVIQKMVAQGMEVKMDFKDHVLNKGVKDELFKK